MRPRLKLLFVHVPKAGGISIRKALIETFGPRLHDDYGDGPADPAAPTNFDPHGYLERAFASGYPWLAGKTAVTGHFWAAKYDGVDCERRATILRDPIARAMSLHAFWIAMKGAQQLRDNPVRRYLVENELNFMAFARLPSVNRFYVDHLFRDVDMRSFDYVGDQARLRTDWSAVVGRIGLATSEITLNETRSIDPAYLARSRDLLTDGARMQTLRDLFAADLQFYERWADR